MPACKSHECGTSYKTGSYPSCLNWSFELYKWKFVYKNPEWSPTRNNCCISLLIQHKIINLRMKEFKFKPTIQNTKPLKLKWLTKGNLHTHLVQSDTIGSLSFFSKDYTPLIVSVLGSTQIWQVCAVMSSLNINQTNEWKGLLPIWWLSKCPSHSINTQITSWQRTADS